MNHHEDLSQEIAKEISHTIAQKIATGIALFFAFLIFIVIGGFAVQLLWNWLLPDLFGLRRITLWEALGLLALCRILFGGFGRGGGSRNHGSRRRGREHQAWWKRRQPPSSGEPAATPPAGTSAV
jgi:hypothetical protein